MMILAYVMCLFGGAMVAEAKDRYVCKDRAGFRLYIGMAVLTLVSSIGLGVANFDP